MHSSHVYGEFFGGHKEKGITHLNADYYVHILWDFNLAH